MLILLLSLAFASAPSTQSRAPVELQMGEQRLLRVKGLRKYSVGTTGLVSTTQPPDRDPDVILIKARKPGTTDLWVWKTDGESEVRTLFIRPASRPGPAPPWQRALTRLEEVEVYLGPQQAVLQGSIHTETEARRVAQLKAAFPAQVIDQTELAPALADHLGEGLRRWLERSPLRSRLRLETVAGRHRVSGHLAQAADRPGIERSLRALYPGVELQLETLPDDSPTLYFKVQLLEMKKSRLHSFGISWPSQVSTSFVNSLRSPVDLDLTLQALELEGSLRVLSRPEIAVRTPGQVELFAGGELPIRVRVPRQSETVQWKKFGLTLQLKTTARAGSRVRLEITTEVSHLDESIAVGEVPGLQTNRMQTQVDAEIERPLLLSGLLQEGVRAQAKGLPALRRIPILGALFGSEDFLNDRTELVAILIPYDHPPEPPAISPPAPETPPIPAPVVRHRPLRRQGLVLQ